MLTAAKVIPVSCEPVLQRSWSRAILETDSVIGRQAIGSDMRSGRELTVRLAMTPRQVIASRGRGALFVALLVHAIGGLIAVPSTWASDTERVLQIGLYQNEPKVYIQGDGSPAGLFVDILGEMAQREDWQLEFRQCYWRECLQMLETGQLDLMPDVAPSTERRDLYAFNAVPVTQAWSQLYSSADQSVIELDDLHGLRIAVLEDSAQQHYLAGMIENRQLDAELLRVSTMIQTLEAVSNGDANVAATNNFFGGRMASRFGLVETPVTFDHTSLHFAAPADRNIEILATIDDYLDAWKSDSESPYYTAILKAVTLPSPPGTPGWLYPVTTAAIGIAAVSTLLLYLMRGRLQTQTKRLARSGQQLEHLLASSPVILYSLRGRDMQIEWVSGNVERILGFSRSTVMEADWWERQVHPEDRRSAVRRSTRIFSEQHNTREYRIHDADGKVRHIRDEMRLLYPGSGNGEPMIIGSWTDMSEEHERRQELDFLSTHDPKTGFPNRNLLADRLKQALARADRKHSSVVVVLIDLDRFRHINDTLGISTGDQVLLEIANRLRTAWNEEATIARVGSDEFCIIIEADVADVDIKDLLSPLRSELARPVQIDERTLVVSASIGISTYPRDGHNRESLMAAAELALEAARRAGGDSVRYYEAALSEQSSRRLLLENELRHAVTGNELELYFQPQFRLSDRTIQGMEALVRWKHPQRGLVSPGEFIPLAEETGLIEKIDQWVLFEACRQIADWDASGFRVPRVAVNLSPREFHDDSLVERVIEALSTNGLSGERLEVEITETMLMEFPERAMRVVHRLESLGINLCMDDFGSGYSNLAFIRRLPLHQLKIDRSLIREIEQSRHNRLIIQAIVAMAEALELELVAEGIETAQQLDFLIQAGCRVGQGFILGRPLPASAIDQLPATRSV